MSRDSACSSNFFGVVQSSSIQLDDEASRVSRKNGAYNGLVFSARPLQIGDRVTFYVGVDKNCCGSLRFGVTSNDPGNNSELPKYLCPMLCGIPGYWLGSISDEFLEDETKLTLYLTHNGCMQVFVDGRHKGSHLSNLPVMEPLWFVADLFGSTISLTTITDDSTPVEIIARGPEAVDAYHLAVTSGCMPIYKTRIMIVGPSGSGKTSIKNLLVKSRVTNTGSVCSTLDENRNSVIDMFTKCIVGDNQDGKGVQPWMHSSGASSSRASDKSNRFGDNRDDNKYEEESSQDFVLEYEKNLEEEYQKALGVNMVRDLLRQKKSIEEKKRSSAGKSKPLTINKKTLSWRKCKSTDTKKGNVLDRKESECKMNVDQDLPDQLVDIVEKLLQEAEVKQDWDQFETEKKNGVKVRHPCQINVNVWDWSGHSDYFVMQQIFFTSRAVYLLVYDVSKDFDDPSNCNQDDVGDYNQPLNYVEQINYWLQAIYSHAGTSSASYDNKFETVISPKVLLVGTHKNQLHSDPSTRDRMAEAKHQRIMSSLRDKPYASCVVDDVDTICVDICESYSVLETGVCRLRTHLETILTNEWYMGEEIPLKWFLFERSLSKLVQNGNCCVDLDTLRKVCADDGCETSEEGLKTMLQFYHNVRRIIYFGDIVGSVDDALHNIVILSPRWLLDSFYDCLLLSPSSFVSQEEIKLFESNGVINGSMLSKLASRLQHEFPMVLGLLERFELICKSAPANAVNAKNEQHYLVPTGIKSNEWVDRTENVPTEFKTNSVVKFYIVFKGFVYDGVMGRIMTRIIKWSRRNGGTNIQLCSRRLRVDIDENHDLEVELLFSNRLKVSVIRVMQVQASAADNQLRVNSNQRPVPHICALVRHFIESSLEDIRIMWEKRLVYQTCVSCWCPKDCALHNRKSCVDEKCLHFLPLDECLINKVVSCDYRRLKTWEVQCWFPEIVSTVRRMSNKCSNMIGGTDNSVIRKPLWDVDAIPNSTLPEWVSGAAKFLNAGCEGQDWAALATKLGYKEKKISEFQDDMSPAFALIADWMQSCGNTKLSTDMMLSCVEEMKCADVIDLIRSNAIEKDPPPVFISYQWDSQDEVLLIRNRLESLGYSCWMDVGQMGGGDLLYQQIYDGISNCKVMVCCISPKYIVSNLCSREVSLADALNKPIIPVMIETTPWPPVGAMGLAFSQLVYVSMCKSGGHGGSGKHSDWHTRLQEVVLQVSKYVTSPINLNGNDGFIRLSDQGNKWDLRYHAEEAHGAPESLLSAVNSVSQETGGAVNDSVNHQRQSPNVQRNQLPAVSVTRCTICSIL